MHTVTCASVCLPPFHCEQWLCSSSPRSVLFLQMLRMQHTMQATIFDDESDDDSNVPQIPTLKQVRVPFGQHRARLRERERRTQADTRTHTFSLKRERVFSWQSYSSSSMLRLEIEDIRGSGLLVATPDALTVVVSAGPCQCCPSLTRECITPQADTGRHTGRHTHAHTRTRTHAHTYTRAYTHVHCD